MVFIKYAPKVQLIFPQFTSVLNQHFTPYNTSDTCTNISQSKLDAVNVQTCVHSCVTGVCFELLDQAGQVSFQSINLVLRHKHICALDMGDTAPRPDECNSRDGHVYTVTSCRRNYETTQVKANMST
jgi:hypothetical protein